MSHLDEGLLTALLDNELPPAERQAADAHLGACAECRRLLEEVKAVAAEADGLVESIQLPARRAAPSPDAAAVRRPRWMSGRWRALAWAASVMLALGLGWMASDVRQTHSPASGPGEGALASRVAANEAETLRDSGALAGAAAPAPIPAPAPAPASKQPAAPPDARRATPAAEPEKPAAKAVGQMAAAAADRLDEAALPTANAPAPQQPPSVGVTAAPPARALASGAGSAFRQVGMEEAVRALSGSIRLVDGLRPQRILMAPGRAVAGADPAMDLIRVVYEDPPGRELWLDQQRPAERDGRARAAEGGALLAGDTVAGYRSGEPASVRWIDQRGFRLGLTGFLSTDSLRALIRRVD